MILVGFLLGLLGGFILGAGFQMFEKAGADLAALDGELSGDDYRRFTEKGDPGTVHR